jgi:predicted amidophosphoribosyltransferase
MAEDNFLEGCAHQYRDLADGSLVCTICGLNVTKWGEVLPPPPAFCTACSAPWTPGFLTCLHCGASSDATAWRWEMLMGGPANRRDTRAGEPPA